MWLVIKPFADMKDKDHSCEGDPFPKEVSEERNKELSSKKKEPLIEERSSDEKPSKKRGRPKKKE